ncbi:hypothetical protein Tco_1568939 [Tanacetum coccineum]
MDLDARISLIPPHVEVQGRYGQNLETQEGFSDGQEVSTAAQVSTASTFISTASPQRNANTTADDLTLAETLMEIRKSVAKDKGKAKMDETESPRKMKQREQVQISRDEEVAQKLQEEFDAAERQRMAQGHQAAQLQAGEKFSEEDLPIKLVELVNQRKKFFAQQRAKAKMNKPMIPAQQKDYMSNYIKNQEGGYSIKQFKSHSFEKVKDIFETTMRRVQSFVPMGSELEVQRLKRAEAYQIFVDMLNKFDRDDLVKLWDLFKEMFSTTEPTNDKDKEFWVELKRLFKPNNDDILWKFQRGHDIFMLVKKEYPLTRGTLGLMMVARLLVEADKGLIQKLDDLKVNHKFRGGLLGIRGFYNLMLLVQVCAAAED